MAASLCFVILPDGCRHALHSWSAVLLCIRGYGGSADFSGGRERVSRV